MLGGCACTAVAANSSHSSDHYMQSSCGQLESHVYTGEISANALAAPCSPCTALSTPELCPITLHPRQRTVVPCAVPHVHASNIESPRQASQPRMHPEARGMLCRRTCDLSFTYRAKYHRFCSGDVSSPSRISTSTLCRTRPRLRALRMKPEMPSSALPAREACPKPALNTPHAGAKICNSKHGLHTRKLLQLRQSQPFGLTNKACAQAQ